MQINLFSSSSLYGVSSLILFPLWQFTGGEFANDVVDTVGKFERQLADGERGGMPQERKPDLL